MAASFGLLLSALVSGCAVDNRLGPALGQALLEGPVRTYATQQATEVAREALTLAEATYDEMGNPRDLASARLAWLATRLAYDRGAPFSSSRRPSLIRLDGRFDDPLAATGLRRLEPVLFSAQPISASHLEDLGRQLRSAGVALANAMPDPARQVGLAAPSAACRRRRRWSAPSSMAPDSPYAAASHLSIEQNLLGLQAMYLALSPAVKSADPALHDQLTALFAGLLQQIPRSAQRRCRPQ